MTLALITGASGFVGSWLCERLLRGGHKVLAVVRRDPKEDDLVSKLGLCAHPDLQFTVQETLNARTLNGLCPDSVFHLAGWSQVVTALADPKGCFEANAAGTWTLLDAIRKSSVRPRIVIASTDGIYGETTQRAAVESDALAALGPYEASKAAADIAARSFAKLFGLSLAVARLGNVYGPGDRNRTRLIPAIQDAVARGERPVARGGGLAIRTYLNVADCLEALLLLAQNADRDGIRGEAFNVTSEIPRTTLEVMQSYLEAAGRSDLSPIVEEAAPGELSAKVSSSNKIFERLGWKESTPFDVGLREVISRA